MIRTLCFLVALSSGALAEIPDELLTSPLAEAFGAGPTIDRPRLSPDGTKMLFLQQRPGGGTELRTIDFAELEQRSIITGNLTNYDIEWCEWASATRIVCDMVFAIDYDGSQMVQLDDGRVVPVLEGSNGCGIIAEVGATRRVPDSLPENPDHIAMNCTGLAMVDTYTGAYVARRAGTGVVARVLSDGRGQPRLQRYVLLSFQFDRWWARTDLDSDWLLVHERDPTIFEDPFRPVGFGADTNRLFHLAWQSGRWALYSMDLAEGEGSDSELAFSHPLLDIEHVDTFGPYDRVIAAAWLDGRPQRFIVDDRAAEVYETAEQLLPQHNIEVVDESWDQNSYLVLARSPARAGSYYLLDMRTGELNLIGPEYERLTDLVLAETQTITFPSSSGDGTVTGHLTLPADREQPIGAVIIPRGIPHPSDIADPHYLVQFLAANGYAVLRVNFRGTDEFGGWLVGERAILGSMAAASDVTDAAHALVESGIVEEDRICALGSDYGAQAAFLSAARSPDLFACIVSIAGITTARATAGGAFLVQRNVFWPARDLRDWSPAAYARDIESAVLLFHSRYDRVVNIFDHSINMNHALSRRNVDVRFIEYTYDGHDIRRAPYRIDMLTRIATFLGEQIGEGQP